MSRSPLALGIDIGTSGVRAVAMEKGGEIAGQAAARLSVHGANGRDPAVWRRTLDTVLADLFAEIDPGRIVSIAVDGTSGTVLPVTRDGEPLADALMYSDPVEDRDILVSIATRAPSVSAAHGATSGLAKVLQFRKWLAPWKSIHQADWIAGLFTGRFDLSDENNALKTGYDPVSRGWPAWIGSVDTTLEDLPEVRPPGTPFGSVSQAVARRYGFGPATIVAAGTTDGCASFLATGASQPGEGVTALGSSLTVKVLSDTPIFAPQYGLYSHRIGKMWLAGGASNTGGKVLATFFDADRIATLSARIDPALPTGLDYYPLTAPGERFPIADPTLPPRLEPRPADDARFLQGLFEGIAGIEARAYALLAELGGPRLTALRSVGGGAANPVFCEIRCRRLGVPFLPAFSDEAAAGTARLAWMGVAPAEASP
ncbi:MAG: FGGY-family carbohydrate kinase [Rhizobiaceae bacterium]|nr:FGGY-family carbohydrate kinase [Rhizobiaceae bacterium]